MCYHLCNVIHSKKTPKKPKKTNPTRSSGWVLWKWSWFCILNAFLLWGRLIPPWKEKRHRYSRCSTCKGCVWYRGGDHRAGMVFKTVQNFSHCPENRSTTYKILAAVPKPFQRRRFHCLQVCIALQHCPCHLLVLPEKHRDFLEYYSLLTSQVALENVAGFRIIES